MPIICWNVARASPGYGSIGYIRVSDWKSKVTEAFKMLSKVPRTILEKLEVAWHFREAINEHSSENWHPTTKRDGQNNPALRTSCKCGRPDWSAVFPESTRPVGSGSFHSAVSRVAFTPDSLDAGAWRPRDLKYIRAHRVARY